MIENGSLAAPFISHKRRFYLVLLILKLVGRVFWIRSKTAEVLRLRLRLRVYSFDFLCQIQPWNSTQLGSVADEPTKRETAFERLANWPRNRPIVFVVTRFRLRFVGSQFAAVRSLELNLFFQSKPSSSSSFTADFATLDRTLPRLTWYPLSYWIITCFFFLSCPRDDGEVRQVFFSFKGYRSTPAGVLERDWFDRFGFVTVAPLGARSKKPGPITRSLIGRPPSLPPFAFDQVVFGFGVFFFLFISASPQFTEFWWPRTHPFEWFPIETTKKKSCLLKMQTTFYVRGPVVLKLVSRLKPLWMKRKRWRPNSFLFGNGRGGAAVESCAMIFEGCWFIFSLASSIVVFIVVSLVVSVSSGKSVGRDASISGRVERFFTAISLRERRSNKEATRFLGRRRH